MQASSTLPESSSPLWLLGNKYQNSRADAGSLEQEVSVLAGSPLPSQDSAESVAFIFVLPICCSKVLTQRVACRSGVQSCRTCSPEFGSHTGKGLFLYLVSLQKHSATRLSCLQLLILFSFLPACLQELNGPLMLGGAAHSELDK